MPAAARAGAGARRGRPAGPAPRPGPAVPRERGSPDRNVLVRIRTRVGCRAMAQDVSDQMIDRLEAWGVKRIYGYPGDGINGFFGALRRGGRGVGLHTP